METDHIEKVLKTQKRIDEKYVKYFKEELKYRKDMAKLDEKLGYFKGKNT